MSSVLLPPTGTGTGHSAFVALTAVVFVAVTAAAAVVAVRSGRLPDALVLPGIVAVLALALLAGRGSGAIVRAPLLSVPMFVVHLAWPDGLGFGDVKFGLLLGAGIGIIAAPLVVPAYLLAAITHAILCVAVRARDRLVPFGPALAAASILTVVVELLRRL